jgi:rhamnosyltransferase
MEMIAKDICAIIVTYNPDLVELRDNLKLVAPQVAKILIVDNSTDQQLQEEISLLNSKTICVILLKGNFGIAEAQNCGLTLAFKDYRCVLFLDQDSILPTTMVQRLCRALVQLEKRGEKVAAIGPIPYDRDSFTQRNYLATKAGASGELVEVSTLMSSGSLITKEAYKIIGEMDSSLFIDLVDWEWCWRARNMGYRSYLTATVEMGHRLGEGHMEALGLYIGVAKPIRQYYQFRNILLLMKRNYIPLGFKVKYIFLLPAKFIFYSLFVPPRKKRARFMLLGIFDALRGVSGPKP